MLRSLSEARPPSGLNKLPKPAGQSGVPFLDKDAFSVLDQLQELLPPEETERYLLLEMNLAQETHFLARKIYKQSRRQRLETNSSPKSKPPGRSDPARLSSSIDPQVLKQQLLRKIEEDQLYLIEDLSLSDLAHELAIEPYLLTRFINHHLHSTFHDLINAYRIKDAQERLRHAPSETILDIAFAVGFNSKASFNRIFKKTTGTTPSQYRKLKENSVSEAILRQNSH